MSKIKIITEDNKNDFEEEVEYALRRKEVADIKFAVTPNIHSTGLGGSYSSGETYYAMIIYK